MKKKGRRGDFILLVALCVVGVILGRFQTTARDGHRPDFVSLPITSIVNPPARMMSAAANSVADFFAGVFSARSLVRQVEYLKAKAAAADQYAEQIADRDAEIDQLRRLSQLGRKSGRVPIIGDVIAYLPYENRMTVAVGSDDGVVALLAVVTPEGLVGTVQTVQKHTCQVLLVTSPQCRIGAVVQAPNPPAGLLKGEGTSTLTLELFDTNAHIKTGDQIISSGFSEKIPRGIRIGRVIQVVPRIEYGTLNATVFPDATVGNVRQVAVLK